MALVMMGNHGLKAQSVSSLIQGTVVDKSGAVVPGADVALTNGRTGTVLKIQTDAAGLYSFPSVLPGVYSLEITKPSFTRYQVSQFSVVVGQRVTENATLNIAFTTQSVTVNAGGLANLLEPESNDLVDVIAPQSVAHFH